MSSRSVALLLLAVACASELEYLRRGDELVGKQSFEAAQAEYFRALELNPESASAHLGLGIVYLYLGRFDEAEQAIDRARRIEDSERALVTLSLLRQQQKSYAEAAKLLGQALARAPESAMLHYRLGMVQLAAGDVQSAVETLSAAVTLDPSMLDAHAQLATALMRLKRYQEAIDVLTEARKRFAGKEVAGIQTSLGEVYEAMNMVDYAKHAYEQAQKRDPQSIAAACGLARAMRASGAYSEAVEALQNGLRAEPDAAQLHLELGITFKEYQLKPQAVQSLLRVTELEPLLAAVYPPLISLLEGEADQGKLYDILAKASRALPDDLAVQLRFGRAAYDRGDHGQAVSALKRAIAIEPSNVDANYYLGLAQLRGGARDAAMETYEALKYLDAAKAEALLDATAEGGDKDAAAKPRRKRARSARRRSR